MHEPITNDARVAYYSAIEKIAAELALAIDQEGFDVAHSDDARDFANDLLEEYVGGSCNPNTPPFGDPISLQVSHNVEAGLADGQGAWEDDDIQRKIYFVVRYDVLMALGRLRPFTNRFP